MRRVSSFIGIILGILFSIVFAGVGFASNFASGNIVVLRSGNTGSSNTATAYLDEFTIGGSLVQTITLPMTISGSSD